MRKENKLGKLILNNYLENEKEQEYINIFKPEKFNIYRIQAGQEDNYIKYIEKMISDLTVDELSIINSFSLKNFFPDIRDRFIFLDNKLSINYKKDNLEIIGLNYKDNTENAKKFLKNYSSPYKLILSDSDGLIAIEWGAYGVPESFLIYDKKIIKKVVGPLNNSLVIEIEELIK